MVKGLSVHPRHLLLFCMLNVSTHHRLYRILWGIDPWQNSPLQRVFQNLPMTVGQSCQKQIIDPLTRPGAIFAAIHPPFHNLSPPFPPPPFKRRINLYFIFTAALLGTTSQDTCTKSFTQCIPRQEKYDDVIWYVTSWHHKSQSVKKNQPTMFYF